MTIPRRPKKDQLWTLFQVDQGRISALDTIMMTIRGWTVTLVSALVGFSLSQHHRNLLAVAVAATVLFAMLDVGYRRVQLLHIDRARKVEQEVAPAYRLRPRGSGRSRWLTALLGGGTGYNSSISFYGAALVLLLLLWILT